MAPHQRAIDQEGSPRVLEFALKTLIADRGKLLSGVAGVVFSLVLMCVQGGLYLGLMRKSSVLIDHCTADLWVGHREVEDVDLAREIPAHWQNRLRGIPGVEAVKPYLVGRGTALLGDGRVEDIWIVGSDPVSMLGTAWGFVEGSPLDLRRPQGVSFDQLDAPKLGYPNVGDWLEINGHRARFVARTNGVSGFITMPYLFTSFEAARRMAHVRPGACSFLLVTLAPSADALAVQALARARLPEASVRTPQEFARDSRDYWMKRTGIGISFGASTVLGLLVGLMFVGQSLYALALDHLDEYATLKALGAESWHLFTVTATQALAIACVGVVAGLVIVGLLCLFWNSPIAPLEVPTLLLLLASAVVMVICLVASVLPLARIRAVDPAIVLTG
jgi:putative ABC transport system permease protein